MAPWLEAALRAVPWGTLLAQAPTLIEASRRLLERRSPAPPATPAAEAGGIEAQLAEIRARLDALEPAQGAQAQLLRQMAEQLERVAGGLATLAARQRLLMLIAGAGLTLAAAVAVWLLAR